MTDQQKMIELALRALGRAVFKQGYCDYRWAKNVIHGISIAAINLGANSSDLVDIQQVADHLNLEEVL